MIVVGTTNNNFEATNAVILSPPPLSMKYTDKVNSALSLDFWKHPRLACIDSTTTISTNHPN